MPLELQCGGEAIFTCSAIAVLPAAISGCMWGSPSLCCCGLCDPTAALRDVKFSPPCIRKGPLPLIEQLAWFSMLSHFHMVGMDVIPFLPQHPSAHILFCTSGFTWWTAWIRFFYFFIFLIVVQARAKTCLVNANVWLQYFLPYSCKWGS